jgi:hypothetical protein
MAAVEYAGLFAVFLPGLVALGTRCFFQPSTKHLRSTKRARYEPSA